MTIRHLKIFIAVYEEQNMTSAANRLFMTQPSVSQAVRELENFYGVSLFERLAKKLFVTEFGKQVYHYAIPIINLFDELENTIKADSNKIKLTVGANYTVGTVFIHKYIQKFNTRYPDSEVRVIVNKASTLLEMLRENKLDFALIEEIKAVPDLVQEYFCEDRIAVVVAPEHPLFGENEVAVSDLIKERLLLREKGSGVRNLFEAEMNQMGFSITPYWESTSTTALIKAAINRIGITVLPFQLIREYLDSGSLVELKIAGTNFSRKLTIVFHKNKIKNTAMKEFVKLCQETE